MTTSNSTDAYHIAAFYHFTELADYRELQPIVRSACRENNICGIILLASEGINGTIAGSAEDLQAILAFIKDIIGDFEYKLSYAQEKPFLRMKVRLKKEIIRLGIEGLQPAKRRGKYVEAQDWNALLQRDDVVVIDTRNDYEVAIGKFKGALDPECQSFGDFPAFVERRAEELRGKKIAMYCTGGIRCEKASAYMLQAGFDEVYQLKGGILKYLEDIAEGASLWQGGCFVFDRRVAVQHGLKPAADFGFCGGCRRAVSKQDQAHPHYEAGVSCPYCYDNLSESKRKRFSERQKQMDLAHKRGVRHLGT